jgi:hypothetical protein
LLLRQNFLQLMPVAALMELLVAVRVVVAEIVKLSPQLSNL